jgi:hypothetical protein
MKKIVFVNHTRNHLRFLIPLMQSICEKGHEALLYAPIGEINSDTISYKLGEMLDKYDNLYFLDSGDKDKFFEYVKDAHAMLVTSGTSNQYHRFDYELCKKVSCKTYAIQHGLSQEGITRLPQYNFSADYVLTWVKKEYILDDVSTPKEKFIPVGVPNHFYERTDVVEGSKVFFFTTGFDKPNSQDIKIDTSNTEWSGIYTTKWKEDTWKKIDELSDGVCYYVRHPTNIGGDLHPTLQSILKRDDKFLVDNLWLQKNNLNRSQLYFLGSKYYITYPSSCLVDCCLNYLDYELFVDYNSKVSILPDIHNVTQGLNTTDTISEILLSD